MTSTAKTTAERQADYVARLNAAGKTTMKVVVHRDVANRLHELARSSVEPVGAVLAKAVQALEAAHAQTSALTATSASEGAS